LQGETPMRRMKQVILTVSVCFTILFSVIEFTPVLSWYASWLAGPWDKPDGDVLIILSSDAQPSGVMGLGSYWSCFYAIQAWRKSHFRAIVVSGGHFSDVQQSAAVLMSEFLAFHGIPKEKIFVEDQSTSTREDAVLTARMISQWPGRKVLLTSDYHMFRALRAFEAVGLSVLPRPFPDIVLNYNSITERVPAFWTLGRESLTILYYRFKGWI
jgi:uncharacterized SAM-binding protein YcdF (DUF218 family)